MSPVISRRAFIVGGTLAGGGLVLGLALRPFSNLPGARALVASDGETLLTTWVKIAPDNTITVSEMGQGVHTALPMMLAEELDADWTLVRMEQAPADLAFANGPLARAFLRGDTSIPTLLAGPSDFAARKIAEFMTLQVTGGSLSVRATGVDGMRRTGAAARWMLVQAAAAEWGVPAGAVTVANSRLAHAASGRSASSPRVGPTSIRLRSYR